MVNVFVKLISYLNEMNMLIFNILIFFETNMFRNGYFTI